eukprot:TRINITY_DN69394_c0_g1_i1.p1 TRINITY_DN69394_c0_g1~~TRINITY_DN69394_c0_g1_i1.p1  ORF type:complete len:634 (-),score=56.29 TRINITY_DN69394_c0_g1_i1:108-2009(-)
MHRTLGHILFFCIFLNLAQSTTFYVNFENYADDGGNCGGSRDPSTPACHACGNGICDNASELDECPNDCLTEVVSTPAGSLRGLWHIGDAKSGTIITSPVAAFTKVPYGATPGLWQDPTPASWTGVLDATKTSPGCPQNPCGSFAGCPAETSMDCLNLDIYAPATAEDDDQLPVIVYLHGGLYLSGGGSVPTVNPLHWAQRDRVIVVSLNVRIGALGGLCIPGLISGNYRIKDEILALEWVKRNIASFGGDANRITLMGQSSGGTDVAFLALSPRAPSFFSAVLLSPPLGLGPVQPPAAAGIAQVFLATLGCDLNTLGAQGAINCARGKTVTEILTAEAAVGSSLTVSAFGLDALGAWSACTDALSPIQPCTPGDNSCTTGSIGSDVYVPFTTFYGLPSDYPLNTNNWLVSFVGDEGTANVATLLTSPVPVSAYDASLQALFGLTAEQTPLVVGTYPPVLTPNQDSRPGIGKMTGDFLFECTTRQFMSFLDSAGATIYALRQEHTPAYVRAVGQDAKRLFNVDHIDDLCSNNMCHSEDLFFVFGSRSFYPDLPQFSQSDRAVSRITQRLLAAFARKGSPSTSIVNWPQYTAATQNVLFVDTTPRVAIENLDQSCTVANLLVAGADQAVAASNQ